MTEWGAYQSPPSMVLGFHGTQKLTVDEVVNQRVRHLSSSKQIYDWLGHGVYFWENDPMRALEWANEKLKPNPDVVGGVINLGFCLDLTTRTGCNAVAEAYQELQKTFRASQKQLPHNTIGKDKLRRELDCLVIMYLHKYRQMAGLPPYDSVRAAFPESDPLYPGAGFSAKGHIQICIRNTAKCIKGYFRPLKIRH